jgi:hypothetical protein
MIVIPSTSAAGEHTRATEIPESEIDAPVERRGSTPRAEQDYSSRVKCTAVAALLGIAFASACEHRTSEAPTPRTRAPADVQRPAAPLVLADIVGRLAAANQFRNIVDLEEQEWSGPAHDACASLGFPARLPAGPASAAGPLAPGSTLTVVHREGATPVVIRELECVAGEEFDAASVQIHFESVRPIAESPSAGQQGRSAPMELVVAAPVHPDARLREPEAIALASSESAQLRRALETAIVDEATECNDDDEPAKLAEAAARTWAKERVAKAHAWWIAADERRLMFAVFEQDCPSRPEIFGRLVDPESGTSLLAESASADISIDAVVDLDGDGTDELLVDIAWMEDGGEDLVLLYLKGGKWTRQDLWSAITP